MIAALMTLALSIVATPGSATDHPTVVGPDGVSWGPGSPKLPPGAQFAVVDGEPKESEWTCETRLTQDPDQIGRVKVTARGGKEALTAFRVIQSRGHRTLIEARPWTGRTHQIRVHLAHAGLPIAGDPLYGRTDPALHPEFPMGLRAVELAWRDPFRKTPVQVQAPADAFLTAFGFGPEAETQRIG